VTTTSPRAPRRLGAAAVLAVAALGLTACAGDDAGSAPSASDASSVAPATDAAPASDASPAASTADGQAAGLTITDPWTKATEEGMTGSFGMLENPSDQDLHIVGVRSELGETVELHEMVSGEDGQMVMQQSPDGFTVPAGGSLELAPGGNHVMFMGLTDPIEPGEDVTYDLELEDGSTLEVTSVVRPFTGANESYHGGESHESEDHADH